MRDGITILLVGSGSAIAVSQQPNNKPTYDASTINEQMIDKIFNSKSIAFYFYILVLCIARNIMFCKIEKILHLFYEKVIETYKSRQ